jgi:uncharacterized protein
VIVLDVNLLIYAYDTTTLHHRSARRWIEEVFSGVEPIGLPWQTVSAFLRVSTNSRLPGNRFSMSEAAEIVDGWTAMSTVHFLSPGTRHWFYFRRMLIDGAVTGPLATDAQLAALTMENGGVLYTTDRDFARFPGLKWTNPLAGA